MRDRPASREISEENRIEIFLRRGRGFVFPERLGAAVESHPQRLHVGLEHGAAFRMTGNRLPNSNRWLACVKPERVRTGRRRIVIFKTRGRATGRRRGSG